MSETSKRIAGVAGASLMLASMGAGAMTAYAADNAAEYAPEATQSLISQDSFIVRPANVVGQFSFSQSEVSPIEAIARAMSAATYLCGSTLADVSDEAVDVEGWTISVQGSVAESYTATIGEIVAEEETRTAVMGCNCMANPADGAASINAEATGVPISALISKAAPNRGANTVVFTSADGYEVAVPLAYVVNRYAPLVFDINGAPLASSVGGVNQLWLGSTSANYFARDIVAITIEQRQTPPPAPGSEDADEAYVNLPNIGIAYGGTIE